MSTHFKIDVSTINLKLKLGNKVSNIIWYITNTEKNHISILAKQHPNDDRHELYVFFWRYAPEIDTILQQIKIPNNIIYIPQERLIISSRLLFQIILYPSTKLLEFQSFYIRNINFSSTKFK